MKSHFLRAVLLAFILATLMPRAAHAQEGDTCEQYYCDAYAMYNGGELEGYVQYWDGGQGWYMGVDAWVVGPSGPAYDAMCMPYDGYDGGFTYCTYSPGGNGIWEIVGEPWYQVEGWEEPDGGSVWYDVGVAEQPSGENTTPGQSSGGGMIGNDFNVTLQPTWFNFDAYQTAESVAPSDDQCWEKYNLTGGPAQTQAAKAFNTNNNAYYDNIASPSSYVFAYQPAVIKDNTSCGWSAYQQMTYNNAPSPYVTRYLTQTIGPGTQVTTCRDTCYENSH